MLLGVDSDSGTGDCGGGLREKEWNRKESCSGSGGGMELNWEMKVGLRVWRRRCKAR